MLGPEMFAVNGVDKLGNNPQLVSRPLDTAFQYIPNTQFLGHILYFRGLALEDEAGVAGDDKQIRRRGLYRDDVLGHAISEIVLFRSPVKFSNGNTAMEGLSGNV